MSKKPMIFFDRNGMQFVKLAHQLSNGKAYPEDALLMAIAVENYFDLWRNGEIDWFYKDERKDNE